MNRTFKPNRQGITLLFVISMIVLFLLMGTAFVIVANDFNRESISRIRSNVPEGKGTQQSSALLEGMMLRIIRGPDLHDIDSPLRANDLLSDQYGYGVKSFVSNDVAPTLIGGEAFVEITLRAVPAVAATQGQGINLLTETLGPLSPSSPNGTTFDNSYGGRVLSFTSGPAKGFSARIYSDEFNPAGMHVFQIPAASISGDIITRAIVNSPEFLGSEVIINGRDFSGTGADVQLDARLNPTGLGIEALLPNRVGQLHADLVGLTAGSTPPYLVRTNPFAVAPNRMVNPQNNSVNEPWDAADIANMYLSGYEKSGALIASFYRRALIDNPPTVGGAAGGRTYFHAFDEGNDGLPDVDTDGDGVNDSFWMETSESVVTNRNGQRFKPLFAIHIRDLDGLLNVNAHSNWSHIRANGFVTDPEDWFMSQRPSAPLGPGMGPAEINLLSALGNAPSRLAALLNARYSGDPDPTVNQLPGNGLNSFRSRAKLFGHPDINDPGNDNFRTVGRLYSTAMDIHGRFRFGNPAITSVPDDYEDPNFANFNNGLPQINMLTSAGTDDTFADTAGDTEGRGGSTKPVGFTDEFSGNPYEMSFGGIATGDSPFTAEELERVLRPNDLDSEVLPDRLSNLLAGSSNRLFTTDSNDVPMLYRDFVETMVRNIPLRNAAITDEDALATLVSTLSALDGQFTFAPELFRGLKMDINRPLDDGNDNDGNGTFGEPDEVGAIVNTDALGVLKSTTEATMDLNYGDSRPTSGATDANPRVIFARHLYMLAMLLLEPVDLDKSGGAADANERTAFAQAMAQWAVNVVDFRDPDSIHTRFVYDPTPFDAQGWNPTTDASGNPLPAANIAFVWGAERPELLLTETLAVHIQNMELNDAATPVYEQRLRPEPFAYFEVYNPWTQNELNQRLPAELYTNGAVNLGRTAPNNSPVWRFEVERVDSAHQSGFKPLRYVYLTDPTSGSIQYDDLANENQTDTDIEIFFNSGNTAAVEPGHQAVIGTQGFADPDDASTFQVFMGRKTLADDMTDDLMLDETTRLALNASTGTVRRFIGADIDPIDNNGRRSTSIVFIDQSVTASGGTPAPRKFSLSDPYEGYPDMATAPGMEIDDGFAYDPPLTASLDANENQNLTDVEIATMVRTRDGINKNFRYVRLQRLANPLIAWNAVTNPYLTIDSMEVDLISINGAEAENGSLNAAGADQAVSHERGDSTASATARAQLWGFQREAMIRSPQDVEQSVDHHFDLAFDESLGRTNDSFAPATAGNPFSWLTWNNRPFVSHMEIMNVPYLAPDRLTYAPETAVDPSPYPTQPFTVGDAPLIVGDTATITNPFGEPRDVTALQMATRSGALAGRYGHLLNFFAAEDDSTNTVSDIYRLLEFIEVPSRFVGAESYYLTNGPSFSGAFTHPFNTISRYRAPGKININTIPPTNVGDGSSSAVWDALISEQVTWDVIKESLYGDYNERDEDVPGSGPDMATDFENPFRTAEAANLVPGSTQQITGSACTLMRPAVGPTPPMPMFDLQSNLQSDNPNRSAAFRNSIRTRLGNLVTTKSSVFACWITVGYFEVDENDELVQVDGMPIRDAGPTTPPVLTNSVAEVGADTGEQIRDRAFFIFDRSIPVAFEPGKNHNIEDAILTKSLQINF